MSQQISIRLSDSLMERIESFAHEDQRTRSAAIQFLLEAGLNETAVQRRMFGPVKAKSTEQGNEFLTTVPSGSSPSETIAKALDTPPQLREPTPQSIKAPGACGFRNPRVPSEKCTSPEGHAGLHSWSSR
jgi:hypothetical protein